MAEEDQDQKTEEPTSKRREEAVKKGNVAVSREVNNFLIMALLAVVIGGAAPGMMLHTFALLKPIISNVAQIPADEENLSEVLWNLTVGGLGILIIPLLGVVVVGIGGNVGQNGLIISTEPMKPQLSRISPMAGFKRLFSVKSVVEMIKNLIKIALVGYIGFIGIYPELSHIQQLPNKSLEGTLLFLLRLASRLTVGVAMAMFVIAIFDLFFQRFQHTKTLRMSKQEIKDEYKQSEGDPVIKQRLRRLRMERAKNRMMQEVPNADAVITNPTHYSIAIKYEGASMNAPIVVAKGKDLVALKIREIAEEHDIPLVENPPLARALFASVDLDEEIPTEHYEAVAKVISYVYQLKGKSM